MQNRIKIWIFVIRSTLDILRGGLVEFCKRQKATVAIEIKRCTYTQFSFFKFSVIALISKHSPKYIIIINGITVSLEEERRKEGKKKRKKENTFLNYTDFSPQKNLSICIKLRLTTLPALSSLPYPWYSKRALPRASECYLGACLDFFFTWNWMFFCTIFTKLFTESLFILKLRFLVKINK